MEIYSKRREKLLSLIGEGAAIIPSGEEKIKSFDTGYPFRQDSNFNYLFFTILIFNKIINS